MIDTDPKQMIDRDEQLYNFYFEHVQALIVCEQMNKKIILGYSNYKHKYVI